MANFTDIGQLSDTAGALYDNAGAGAAEVAVIELHNTDSNPHVVKLYFVPNSGGALGTAGTSNKFFEETLAAGKTYYIENKWPDVLAAVHDSIQGEADAADVVNFKIKGRQN